MPIIRTSTATLATDPLRNFKFQVNIHHSTPSGSMAASLGFMSVSGLNVTTEVIPYRQGGYNTTTQKMPGQSDFSPVTLAKGMVVSKPHQWEWFNEIFSTIQGSGPGNAGNRSAYGTPGNNFRCTVEILVLAHPVNNGNTPTKAKFILFNAWPTALAYSDLDAGGNAVLVEQMTLAHEGFEVIFASGQGDQSDVTNSIIT